MGKVTITSVSVLSVIQNQTIMVKAMSSATCIGLALARIAKEGY